MDTHIMEGWFSIFLRGMKGAYQHGGIHRYLAEFDCRYNNCPASANKATLTKTLL